MIELVKTEKGNLQIQIDDRLEFDHNLDRLTDMDERAALNDLLDSGRYIGNDWHTPTEIGLTEAPAIAYGAIYDSETAEEPADYENLWIFNNYMLESFLETLSIEGVVEFQQVN